MAHSFSERIDWVDYAKGLCIILVVMMHSTLGVGEALVAKGVSGADAEGWLHHVVAFAKPFRMPDFFMVSGLFLARVIDRNWRTYLDRKVVHFIYFYLLWTLIQFAFKGYGFVQAEGIAGAAFRLLETLWEPFGTLWFIYLLPLFFVLSKLLRPLPALVIWCGAAALHLINLKTGYTLIDEFAHRYVFFVTGWLFAPFIFAVAKRAQQDWDIALFLLLVWGLMNGFAVFLGYSKIIWVNFILGFLGAGAVVTVSSLLAKKDLVPFIRLCGERSIVIYLAFFLPMAATRTLLIKLGLVQDVGLMSLLVTLAGVLVPLLIHLIVRGTWLDFLFVRPAALRIDGGTSLITQKA